MNNKENKKTNIKDIENNISEYKKSNQYKKVIIEFIKLLELKYTYENIELNKKQEEYKGVKNLHSRLEINRTITNNYRELKNIATIKKLLVENDELDNDIAINQNKIIWQEVKKLENLCKFMNENNTNISALIIKRIDKFIKKLNIRLCDDYFTLLRRRRDIETKLKEIFKNSPYNSESISLDRYLLVGNQPMNSVPVDLSSLEKEYKAKEEFLDVIYKFNTLDNSTKESINFDKYVDRYKTIHENITEVKYIIAKLGGLKKEINVPGYEEELKELNAILELLHKKLSEYKERDNNFTDIEAEIIKEYKKKKSKRNEDLTLTYLSFVPLEEQQLIAQKIRRDYIKEVSESKDKKTDISIIRKIENNIKQEIISIGRERYLSANKSFKK